MRLLFTDTDSFVYENETENIYDNFSKNRKIFHFSNNYVESKHYDDSNRLVVGKIEDEMDGVATEKTVGLKSKLYSIPVNLKKQNVFCGDEKT